MKLQICVVGNFNSIELYSTVITQKEAEINCLRSLSAHGHRTDVRAICFSSDNLALATASADSIKLWNRYLNLGRRKMMFVRNNKVLSFF